MNYYQIVAFAQHLKKENMNKNNDAFRDDAYNEEKFTHKLIIVVLCVLALSYVGVIKWI